MKRDIEALTGSTHDLLVIGAGIYGAAIAWDAAQRGLSVALIDRADFGGAASWNSLKTIHGGIRSLQRLKLAEMRMFLRERRAFSRIVPHLTRPLPFLLPTDHRLKRNKHFVRGFLVGYNACSWDRNLVPDASGHLPPACMLDRAAFEKCYPGSLPAGMTGAALWYDSQAYSSERITLSFVLSAAEAGAAAANHVEALSFLRSGSRIEGVLARDVITGGELEIRARLTINCAGSWCLPLMDRLSSGLRPPAIRYSAAMNLVIPRVDTQFGLCGYAGSRVVIIVPWRDCSILGTRHWDFDGEPDQLSVPAAEVDGLMTEAREAFPFLKLALSDVKLIHKGLLPALPHRGPDVNLLRDTLIRDHRSDGLQGVMSVMGVRFTTARKTAQNVLDRAFDVLGRKAPPCRTAELPLAGGDIANFDEYCREAVRLKPALSAETVLRLVRSYGTRWEKVAGLIEADGGMGKPIGAGCGVTAAEISYAIENEMAVKLSDVLLRRTEAGTAGNPGRDAIASAAHIMAARHGWDAERVRREIAEVNLQNSGTV